MKEITEESFTAALEAVVAERGEDWTYPELEIEDGERIPDAWHDGGGNCRYFAEGDPDTCCCIIGAAVARLGYTGRDVDEVKGEGQDALTLLIRLGAQVSFRFGDAIKEAQAVQDRGKPWGQALEQFRDILNHEEAEWL